MSRSTAIRPGRACATLALALLACAPARAALHPSAQPAYDRCLAATGGAEARAGERTLHLKGRLSTIGLEGRWELWLMAPDRWVRSYSLGSMKLREGYDGTVAWRTDLTGRTVTVLSDVEARDAAEEGWFLNERWALPDQGGASIRMTSRIYRGSGDCDVLEVTPPVGRPRRLFVDTVTGFIERIESQHDQYTVADQPREYKLLAGRKRASVYQSPTLLPNDPPAERSTVDSVWVNVPVDSARFSPPQVTERRTAWQKARTAIRVPFQYVSNTVIVRLSIDGKPPADFILDTGCSLTVLDTDYAYGIGLVPEGHAGVEGVAAGAETRFARVGSIALLGAKGAAVTLQDFRVGMTDLQEGAGIVLWRRTMGLLGYDFLSRFVVDIDYDSMLVTLHDPATYQHTGPGAPIPFQLDAGGAPVVDLTLDDGCSGRFVVDVGNSFQFVVNGSAVRSCRLMGRAHRREVEIYGGGVGGGFVSTLCRLDSLRIGPYMWTEPVCGLTLHSMGSIGSKDYAGNIGNHLLERFRCTFDYGHRTLWLTPGRRYGQRDRVSRFGALWARVGPRVFAGNILSGSAAFAAGIKWFDEILAIDGKPIDQWTRQQIDATLEEGEVGAVHSVTYKRFRDKPEVTVEVTLKDVL